MLTLTVTKREPEVYLSDSNDNYFLSIKLLHIQDGRAKIGFLCENDIMISREKLIIKDISRNREAYYKLFLSGILTEQKINIILLKILLQEWFQDRKQYFQHMQEFEESLNELFDTYINDTLRHTEYGVLYFNYFDEEKNSNIKNFQEFLNFLKIYRRHTLRSQYE